MADKNKTHYHTTQPAPFILLSVILHLIVLLSYYLLRNPDPTTPQLPTLSIELSSSTMADGQINKPQTPNRPAIESKPTPTRPQNTDSWQQGIESARRLMQQPGFFESLQDRLNQIPNYRADLPGPESPVTALTIDTYRQLENGEMDIVFRYPSGKKVCIRARSPNHMDPFDIGSWQVLVAGCN